MDNTLEHNDGGANCFISNNKSHFIWFKPSIQTITQLDGTKTTALGYGLKLIQCPNTKQILPLWPTYFIPDNTSCTFSPTALKYYNNYPTVTTHHLDKLEIITTNNVHITFKSVTKLIRGKLLDYHNFTVVRPSTSTNFVTALSKLCKIQSTFNTKHYPSTSRTLQFTSIGYHV